MHRHLLFTAAELTQNILIVTCPASFRVSQGPEKESRLPELKTSVSFLKVHSPPLTIILTAHRKLVPTSYICSAIVETFMFPSPACLVVWKARLTNSQFGLLPVEKDRWTDVGGVQSACVFLCYSETEGVVAEVLVFRQYRICLTCQSASSPQHSRGSAVKLHMLTFFVVVV